LRSTVPICIQTPQQNNDSSAGTASALKCAGDRIIVNETLTLAGIPAVVWDYKLSNRNALEWLIDQYQVSATATPIPTATTPCTSSI
jgi:predicted helicase